MGGAWKTQENEELKAGFVGYVEIVMDGPMTKDEVKAFHAQLTVLLGIGRTGNTERKIKLKKGALEGTGGGGN